MLRDPSDFERYFRDPKVGDRVLAQGSSSLACKNIRLGLYFLDFHEGIDFAETYDAALAREVLRFQEAYEHSSRDGQCGPGTRRLLTRVLLDERGENVFKRMTDPEQRDVGQVFVSYSRTDSGAIRSMVDRIRSWGFSVWYDDSSISGSEHFNDAIQHAIESCYLVVACLSEASLHPKGWVVKEVILANQLRKDILPVILGSIPETHPLQLVLINNQRLDARSTDFPERLKTAIKGAHARALK
jgi:hypothetical protein